MNRYVDAEGCRSFYMPLQSEKHSKWLTVELLLLQTNMNLLFWRSSCHFDQSAKTAFDTKIDKDTNMTSKICYGWLMTAPICKNIMHLSCQILLFSIKEDAKNSIITTDVTEYPRIAPYPDSNLISNFNTRFRRSFECKFMVFIL